MELWAGAECTVNRVGERYFDQLERTGHASRIADLERLAALGVRRVRFPILWERTAPTPLAPADFGWSDERMQRLTALGIDPIVGLVHHGSGPVHTGLCDAGFARGLGAYAASVAARYPWVNAYTPVNEPLTTARFSGLYGLWYPHGTELRSFLAALTHQVLATRASMKAIREVNPQAALYQTEDIGSIFSSVDLAGQCHYENERRWLSLDLLSGRVGPQHPLRAELEANGVPARLLDEWCDEPCTPDLIGVNYYVTSDRFLDSNLERYPRHTWGGNGRQDYADTEAVRAHPEGIVGHAATLDLVWQRYRRPCALSEVHLAGHREDQLRWLAEAWAGAHEARALGADVRAVTLWSAFGAVGWNNLVTRESGEYEPGAYDVRAPEPRRTALASACQRLARGESPGTLSSEAGWWRRSSRLSSFATGPTERARAPLLVIGAGAFSARVAALCRRRFVCMTAPTLAAALRALDRTAVTSTAAGPRPWAVVFAADPARPAPVADGVHDSHWRLLRERCATTLEVLVLSSGRVFTGRGTLPHRENDVPDALDAHGTSWRALERTLTRLSPRALVTRCGYLMDPASSLDPLARIIAALQRGETLSFDALGLVSPTYLPHLLDAALDLLVDGESGVWHLAPVTACSPLELARAAAERLGMPFMAQSSRSTALEAGGSMAALSSDRGWPLADWGSQLDAYARELSESSSAEQQRALA